MILKSILQALKQTILQASKDPTLQNSLSFNLTALLSNDGSSEDFLS